MSSTVTSFRDRKNDFTLSSSQGWNRLRPILLGANVWQRNDGSGPHPIIALTQSLIYSFPQLVADREFIRIVPDLEFGLRASRQADRQTRAWSSDAWLIKSLIMASRLPHQELIMLRDFTSMPHSLWCQDSGPYSAHHSLPNLRPIHVRSFSSDRFSTRFHGLGDFYRFNLCLTARAKSPSMIGPTIL